MLTGLVTQAALLLLLLLLEFSEFPEGVDEGLDLEGVEEEEPEVGEVEEVGLGVATLFWIGLSEPEPEVVVVVVGVGWLPGTEVDGAGGVGVVAGGFALLGLGDPPPPLVMVKVGEMLPELPITKTELPQWSEKKAPCMHRLTGDDVRTAVGIPAGDGDVHLSSGNWKSGSKGGF